MGLFDKIFGSGIIKDVAGTVSDVVDKFVLTKQERFDAEQHSLEQEWRFRTLEQESFEKEKQRIVDLYKLDADDRKDAREYAKSELATGDKFVAHFRYWFAACLSLAILSILTGILWFNVPVENNNIVMYVLGVLTSTFTVIVSFYFGSSSGSSIKDQVIQYQSKELGKQL